MPKGEKPEFQPQMCGIEAADRVQAWLFNGQKLVPTFTKAQMTTQFPFNALYGQDDIPDIDLSGYALAVSGLVRDKASWSIEGLRKLPRRTDITRLVCVEGWSTIGQWGVVPLKTFLEHIGADTTAKFVGPNVLTAITPASTCRRHCIRKPCWLWITVKLHCHRSTATH
jgi:DMSO/TMAO reductase YedYZ molybdopterin-dependent catalytic subunit